MGGTIHSLPTCRYIVGCREEGLGSSSSLPPLRSQRRELQSHQILPLAWGAEVHRIIALIAADQLTPSAKAQVEQLVGTDDAATGMMAVSTWDEIRRNRPNTAPWYFTDTPIGS